MLTERAAYFYQVATIAFAFSMMMNLRPIAALTLYLILFMATYTLLASRSLKNLSPQHFPSSIIVDPNPSKTRNKIRITANIISPKKNFQAIVKVDLGGLELVEGSKTWSGSLKDREISLKLSAKSTDPGIKFVGPVKIAIMDPLGIVVKELEVHDRIPVFLLEHDELIGHSSAYSSPVRPSPGFSKEQFVGANYEYRISQPQADEPPAKLIDWRKIAQRDDESIYVKLYDKVTRGDMIFGVGSGLEIDLPNGLKPDSKIVQDILTMLLPHIREGSRVWLMKWIDGKFTTFLIEKSRIIEVSQIPKARYMIHITRLIDDGELLFLRGLISQGIMINLILIDLGVELLKLSKKEYVVRAADLEMRRLGDIVKKLELPCTITSLEDFGGELRRILDRRRTI